MTVSHWILSLAMAAALTASQAHAQQSGMAMHDQAQSPAQDMMAGMAKMNHDMSAAPMTGNPDHDFVAMMIPHHQGAIDMAQVELRYGKDPAIRRLARDVVAAQTKEIAMMRQWEATHPSR
jgi:uncharacterized protein (DUF305 family)